MKIVFMGTPDFAQGALEAIIQAGHEVTCVVTQPDKPKGRSGQMQCPPVKECALEHGIPVFQPVRIKRPEEIEKLRQYEADIYVVAAFGQMLSQEILDIPPLGCVNIHASLLPKYRGASPINWCIINGEQQTGITIMKMDVGMDTGDILTQKVVPIAAKETAESLFERLKSAGAELIVETLPLIERGEITPKQQNESEATHVSLMDKSLGRIDWSKDAVYLERLVRGLNSWPSAFSKFQGKTVKLWSCDAIQEDTAQKPGTITAVTKDYIEVATGKGILRILELQPEGKKRMSTRAFLLGNDWKTGMSFE